MRRLTPWVAGSLLFALAGCSSANPSGAAKNGPGATSGGDFARSESTAGSTDAGSRLFGAEPLGALVVHTEPTLRAAPGPTTSALPSATTSATTERPTLPTASPTRLPEPVSRPMTTTPTQIPVAPPPPPPPPPAFPPPVRTTPAPSGS